MLIRHLTGDPPSLARRATTFLAKAERLLLTDLVVAECVYVLESVYEVPRARAAELMRAVVSAPSIAVADIDLLLRALELYELQRVHFVDAYLIACAELSGVDAIASFDATLAKRTAVTVVRP